MDDNVGLQAEVARLRGRIALLQEEKEVMQAQLNALNIDLSNESVKKQQSAAGNVAAAEHLAAAPPPPPPPLESGGSKKMSGAISGVGKNMGKGMSAMGGLSKAFKKKI